MQQLSFWCREIQRESWSWRIFQSDYKLFISLFLCQRLGKHSENGSEGLALLLRADHPRKQIAIMSLVSSPADSKDHWLITITDEHLAKSRDGGFILTVIRQNWLIIKPWKNLVDAYMRSGAQPQQRKTIFILLKAYAMICFATVVNYYTEYFPFTLPP